MRFSARTWSLLSLLLFVAAAFFWLKGNEHEARKRLAPPRLASTNAGTNARTNPVDLISTRSAIGQLASLSPAVTGTQSPNPITDDIIQHGEADPDAVEKRFPHRLRNTRKPMRELVRDDNAVLLANALIDTRGETPEIPEHLTAPADPGSYIVQWIGPVDDRFRARLAEAGAEIISYVPNNAFYVKVDRAGADRLSAAPGVQSVLPFQPYYKLDTVLLGLAVKQEQLPEGATLRLTFLPGTSDAAQQVAGMGVNVVAQEASPFGPQLIVQPEPNALVPLARLSSVQAIERTGKRTPASDLSRVILGVAANGSTNGNYLGLSGQGVLVNINDTGIQPTHPTLTDTTIHLPAPPLQQLITANNDPDGHGTFVASLIAGNGAQSPAALSTNTVTSTNSANTVETNTVVTANLPGSSTNASLRGLAPNADLLALPLDPTGAFADVWPRLLDTWLIESAAATNYVTLGRTNSLISNNSWTYGQEFQTYDTSAARFDQAVRDALPGMTQHQPLLFVFAAGNRGFGEDDGYGGTFDSIESPGTAKNVITVGALESPRFITNAVYTITNYFYTTNANDNTVTTNEVPENIYPFADATDSQDEVAAFSSRGNVGIGVEGDQGRFKPDVVAPGTMIISARSAGWNFNGFNTNDTNFGQMYYNLHTNIQPYRFESGSTIAAANVSGMLALIQEYFQSTAPAGARRSLSPALMKALLINGTRSLSRNYDVAAKSAANYQGWGMPNLPHSLSSYTTNQHSAVPERKWRLRHVEQSAENALATGQSRTWNVTLNSNAVSFPLRATLVWTDPPGNPLVAVKLVNDLDLVVTNLDTGFVYYGNNIPFGGQDTLPVDPKDPNSIFATDVVNNVEQVTVADPSLLGQRFSVTVRARRVNVNSVPDYFAVTRNANDVVQDYALVISSDMGADPALNDPDPTNPDGYIPNLDVFDQFTRLPQVNIEPRAALTRITNGLPLFDQRVGANPSLFGTNGTVGQWNFYVFTNINETNAMVTTSAGSNVAFVTFNPPNLSRPRAIEADIDVYVSKDPQLTNLNPNAVAGAFKSLERGGTESVVFTNGVIGDVYYIGVKAEDQQAAEFSLIGVSSDRPFEEERNGRIYLYGVPIEAGIPDGNNRRPQAGTMLAIGLSNRRVAHAQVTTSTFHQNYPDLVGVLTKQQTRVFLNNHNTGRTNYGTNIFTYEDNPMFANAATVTSDGPGSLNDLAGHKVVGPWFLEMIDSSPGQTGRVQRFEIAIVPLNENLEIGTLITGSVDPGQMAFYPLETPPGATNINFLFSNVSGPLEFYWREGALPTTNLFDFNRSISPPGANFSLPVQPNRTYYMGLRNPGGSVVNFTLLLTAQFADADYNHFLDDRILDDVLDVATTNSVIDVNEDKLVSDLRVGVQMKHPRTADIALTLISPQGSRILLAENRGYTNGAGFGSSSTVTNRAPDGTTYITNRAEYVIFTEHTNLARIPVKFANPGTTNSLGSVGVAFASSFEGSVLAGNYQSGTVLASGWRVSGGGQISVINGPRLAHTGDTLMSLGTGGLTRQIPLTSGRSYTVRFAARKGPLMDFLSTGVDATRAPIPPGTPDPNYFIIPDTLSAYVLDTNASVFLPPASWNTNDNRSQWIAPYYQLPATNTEGQIVFRTYINLYEHPSPVAYSRQFRWSGDDVGSSIRVNGASFAFAGAPSSNFFGSSTYSVSGLRNGLNWVDFFVENTNDVAAGLRVEVLPAPPWTKVAAPQMIVSIGGVSQTITVGDNWSEQELTFVPTSSSGTLTLQSSTGEVWVDSVIVESSGGTFLQPEESFELLEGERAMGEWRLEVRDTRSGAVLQTRDFLQWSLELSFADTFNPALRMQPGDISGPITIGSEEVQWVVLDPCQGATFARLRLRGIGNFDELAMLADLSGFPTGLPENDDFLPMWNNENPGQLNGVATFEISSLMPAPARMTGKPIFIGIINQFVGVTNQFELEFISDGNCTLAGPPPILTEDNPATGSLDPNTSGSGSTNNAGVFQFIVPPQARAAIITVVSDGDVTVYGQKDTIPTTSTFSYRVDAVPGAGTEILRIDGASTPALTPGDYFIRIANDSAQRVNFTVSLSFEYDTGPAPLELVIIRTSNGALQLQYFPTEVGVTYIIEGTDELGPTANWTTIATTVAASNFETYPITVDLLRKHRFFRVRRQ